MDAPLDVVEGWTQRLGPFTLKIGTSTLNLTGFSSSDITLKLRKVGTTGAFIDTTGDVVIDAVPTTGKVYFDPDPTDFVCTNPDTFDAYQMRWEVIDSLGKVGVFPSGLPDITRVWKI